MRALFLSLSFSLLSGALPGLFPGLFSSVFPGLNSQQVFAAAPEVPVLSISEPRLVEDSLAGLAMSGQVSVTLSPVLISAIERGVPLVFVSDFQILRERWWWFDQEVLAVRREARLTFHPLTRQFRVSVDGSKPQAFSDLTEALKAGMALKGWRVMPEPMPLEGLTGRVRLQLDMGALPKALQVTAITDQQWKLDTGWVRLEGLSRP